MRTLYILRHAKSAWPQGVEDKERPLSADGRHEAKALGQVMAQEKIRPDFTLCSPARRTRETLALIGAALPELETQFEERLYLANSGPLYEILKAADSRRNSLLLISHNPGIHGLVRFLTGGGDSGLIMQLFADYPPGRLAVLDCPCETWSTLMPAANRLTALFSGTDAP